jgi:hypothetical protein
MEREICKVAIESLLEANACISVFDGEAYPLKYSQDAQQILDNLFAVDEEVLRVYTEDRKYCGSVWLIHGNDGYDVIVDNTEELDRLLLKAGKLADKFEEEGYA